MSVMMAEIPILAINLCFIIKFYSFPLLHFVLASPPTIQNPPISPWYETLFMSQIHNVFFVLNTVLKILQTLVHHIT
jgi:hypothetical protein